MAGASPTFASIWTQLGKAVKVVNEVEKFGSSNSPNLYDLEDDIVQNLDGEFTPAGINIVRSVRNVLSQEITPSRLQAMFSPFLQEMARAIGAEVTARSDLELLSEIRQYMADTSADEINSRGMTMNQPSPGANTGTGLIHRLTTDWNGDVIECTGPESKRFECITDQNQGQKYQEVFRLKGQSAERDLLFWDGSGNVSEITCLDGSATQTWLQNPSFDANDASSDLDTPGSLTTGITSWTIGSSAANFALRTGAANVYRGMVGQASTIWGLEFLGNDSISQAIQEAQPGTTFDPRIPYYAQIAWNRQSGGDGTLELALGSQVVTVVVSTGTNGVWNVLQMPLGSNAWYDNFRQDGMTFKVTLSGNGAGSVITDDAILAPYTNLDGTWYAAVGGGDTAPEAPYLREDIFTLSDNESVPRAIFSHWLWKAYGPDGWLPSNNAGGETITDPA